MLEIKENTILQTNGIQTKIWSIPELLETNDPLPGEPIAERNAALRQVVGMAEEIFSDLSDAARLRCDFWQQLQPNRISELRFEYTTKVVHTYQWELTINGLGLFYKDLSGEYDSRLGWVSEQLFSDFWFYGPLQPIPDLRLREKIIGIIRSAFLRSDCPAVAAHFELFEYPSLTDSDLYWSEGDYNRSDFVSVCKHGIEIGYLTWRDAQPMTWFLSFENFLRVPPRPHSAITPNIRSKIEQFLGKKSKFGLSEKGESTPLQPLNPPTPRPKMDLTESLLQADPTSETGKTSLFALSEKEESIPPAPPTLPTPREKMDLAESLLQSDPTSAIGAETLISLLEYEAETDYWRNYVFNSFFRIRDNPTVQNFIILKLEGDHEIHFKKAVDVLHMWGMKGDNTLTDKNLLNALNWHDATANDPNFRAALEKTIKLILKK